MIDRYLANQIARREFEARAQALIRDTGIDGYLANQIARREFEARAQAFIREEKLHNDILPDDLALRTAYHAGSWQFPKIAGLLEALGQRVVSFVTRRKQLSHGSEPGSSMNPESTC